jgi:hypothetical protein
MVVVGERWQKCGECGAEVCRRNDGKDGSIVVAVGRTSRETVINKVVKWQKYPWSSHTTWHGLMVLKVTAPALCMGQPTSNPKNVPF